MNAEITREIPDIDGGQPPRTLASIHRVTLRS